MAIIKYEKNTQHKSCMLQFKFVKFQRERERVLYSERVEYLYMISGLVNINRFKQLFSLSCPIPLICIVFTLLTLQHCRNCLAALHNTANPLQVRASY